METGNLVLEMTTLGALASGQAQTGWLAEGAYPSDSDFHGLVCRLLEGFAGDAWADGVQAGQQVPDARRTGRASPRDEPARPVSESGELLGSTGMTPASPGIAYDESTVSPLLTLEVAQSEATVVAAPSCGAADARVLMQSREGIDTTCSESPRPARSLGQAARWIGAYASERLQWLRGPVEAGAGGFQPRPMAELADAAARLTVAHVPHESGGTPAPIEGKMEVFGGLARSDVGQTDVKVAWAQLDAISGAVRNFHAEQTAEGGGCPAEVPSGMNQSGADSQATVPDSLPSSLPKDPKTAVRPEEIRLPVESTAKLDGRVDDLPKVQREAAVRPDDVPRPGRAGSAGGKDNETPVVTDSAVVRAEPRTGPSIVSNMAPVDKGRSPRDTARPEGSGEPVLRHATVPRAGGEAWPTIEREIGITERSRTQGETVRDHAEKGLERMPPPDVRAGFRAVDAVGGSNAQLPPQNVIGAKVINQIARAAKVHLFEGGGDMTVRLDPPHLGVLHMSVSAREGTVMASLHTSTETTRQILEADLPLLRRALADAGINVDSIEVSVGSSPNPGSDPYAGPHGRSAHDHDTGSTQYLREPLEAEARPESATVSRPVLSGGFDYLA